MGIAIIVEPFLFELGVVVLIATVLGIVFRKLGQPLILAYIIAGIISGPVFLNIINSYELVYVFARLGVVSLLFMVGMNLNSKVLGDVGKTSLLTGVGQVLFTFSVGYVIGTAFGLGVVEAAYVAIALTFSSTIIIVKLLTDKNDLDSLYGKISVGFLLVQDFIAIIILVVLSGISAATSIESLLVLSISKMALLFAVSIFAGRYIAKFLMDSVAASQEILLLFGISWMVMLSWLSFYLGFSIEIGALLAGISLARVPYRHEIENKVRPLRDFFLVLFFVVLGSQMTFALPQNMILMAAIFSAFVLLGNPLIVMAIMGALGYKRRTGFLSGLTVAQISEFSLVLVALGVSLGHVTGSIMSMVAIIGIATISVSSYMIIHGDAIYRMLGSRLSLFERKYTKENGVATGRKHYDIVLLGFHRIGHAMMEGMGKNKGVLVVDFNPSVLRECRQKGMDCIYGDITDSEVVDKIISSRPKAVVSTIPDYKDSLFVMGRVRRRLKGVKFFMTTTSIRDAMRLYGEGADYVIVPDFLGGKKASILVRELLGKNMADIRKQKKNHITELGEYWKLGHAGI